MAAPHKPELDTPELDSFLLGASVRRLQGAERRSALRDVFAEGELPAAPDMDPALHPHRIMVMWRLCRTTALAKGLCSEDETLDRATDIDPDPWVTPFKPHLTPSQGAALRRARVAQLGRIHSEGEGLPLLPPRADAAGMSRWCNAASIVASDLGVERSREGLLGLQGLLDPQLCARCDVSGPEVIAFEEMLLAGALNLLLDSGERAAIGHFRDNYGFSLKEANSLLRVVKTQALERSGGSIEEKRALAEMRLEDQLGRYKETMDMDGELKAIKELSRIQGLTRTEPENQAAEFFDVVKRVSARQDRELLDPETLRLIEGVQAEEVDAIVIEAAPLKPSVEDDPDDAEALAEYDAENQHK
jgi:hypothetical protein